jgi:hypothetical protein
MQMFALILQQMDTEAAKNFLMGMMFILPIFILVCLALVILPLWFICKKAGFSPWLSLLVVVPLGSLILLYVLAFADWKVVPASQVVVGAPPPYPPMPPQPPVSTLPPGT